LGKEGAGNVFWAAKQQNRREGGQDCAPKGNRQANKGGVNKVKTARQGGTITLE